MFDWGFTEFLLVAVVGLLVFGPERLPEVARNVGRWVGKARRYIANVRSDFESEFNTGELRELLGEQQEQIRELKGMVSNAQSELKESFDEVSGELTEASDALNKSLSEDQAPLSARTDEELFADDDLPVAEYSPGETEMKPLNPEEHKSSSHD